MQRGKASSYPMQGLFNVFLVQPNNDVGANPSMVYYMNHGNHRESCTEKELQEKLEANCSLRIGNLKLLDGVYSATFNVYSLKNISSGDEVCWNYREQSTVFVVLLCLSILNY